MTATPAATTPDAAPRTDLRSDGPAPWGWLFQRVSGLLLLALAGLFAADRYLLGGVDDITALDLARRWSDPWWRLADFAFVVVAAGHVLVGLHVGLRRAVPAPRAASGLEVVGAVVIGALALRASWTVLTF